ncbi:hypothetical protein DV702_12870 [Sporosarcina sp. PTS2304]|uniref:hypothetical protein n=1 Tax=Sporosarcina sp. PTS2304 TaxID=2283194 RepID=UPI000E0E02AF|nr:hypothetical protein [Sporosarcina sp. PTS2304]AXI00534.1 hypothetical protein DV702_12870 [Sporosarcina sp. PTS2304]
MEVIDSVSYPTFDGDVDPFRLFLYDEINAYLIDYNENISHEVDPVAPAEKIAQKGYEEIGNTIIRLIQDGDSCGNSTSRRPWTERSERSVQSQRKSTFPGVFSIVKEKRM